FLRFVRPARETRLAPGGLRLAVQIVPRRRPAMTEFVIFVVVMIVLSLITKARQQATRGTGKPNPKMQALIERLQAQQGGNQPVQFQGQFTRAAGPGGPPPAPTPGQPTGPVHVGTPQGSQQAAAVLQQ